MTRIIRLTASLTFLWLLCVPVPMRAADSPKPNVLLICVDDLKPLLGCYGDKVVKSPNIDRLAARGVLFERAYCNQAVCAPSRNALMTGVRPSTVGIYDLGTNFRVASPNAVTLSQYFMRHGYRAEGLGKIFHVGHGNHEDPASWSVPHYQQRSIAYVKAESRANQGLTREEALFANQEARGLPRGAPWESADVSDDAYPDGKIAEEAIRRLRAAKENQASRSSLRSDFSSRTCPSARRRNIGTCTTARLSRCHHCAALRKARRGTRRATGANCANTATCRNPGHSLTIRRAQ